MMRKIARPSGTIEPIWLRNHSLHPNQVEHHRTRTFQQDYLAFLKRHEHSTRCRLLMPGLRSDDKLSLELTMPSTVRDGASLHLYPGTSCLATIGLSLRDKNHSTIEASRHSSQYPSSPALQFRTTPVPQYPNSPALQFRSTPFPRVSCTFRGRDRTLRRQSYGDRFSGHSDGRVKISDRGTAEVPLTTQS